MPVATCKHLPGLHADTNALRNVLECKGVSISEELVFGIAGGIGAGVQYCPSFLKHGVGGGVTVVGRHMVYVTGSEYHQGFCDRLGLKAEFAEATSDKKALKNLTDVLAGGGPAIVWCGPGISSAFSPDKPTMCSMFTAVVYDVDESMGQAVVAGTGEEPITVALQDLALARAAICSHKCRVMSLGVPIKPSMKAIGEACLSGIQACLAGLEKPKMKTFSFESLEEWPKQLTNSKSSKGWYKTFVGGKLFWALHDVFNCIEILPGEPGLFRGIFARFLAESADITKRKALKESAEEYGALSREWSSLAEVALPNSVKAFKESKALLRRKQELYRSKGAKAANDVRKMQQSLDDIEASVLKKFPLDEEVTLALLNEMAGRATSLLASERAALERLKKAAA